MPNNIYLIQPSIVGRWIAERSDIWQMNFLDETSVVSFSRDLKLSFWEDHIKKLWQLKLLQADYLISERKLRLAGLIDVGLDDYGRHIYADERNLRRRIKGWTDSLLESSPFPSGVKLYFHPFRYYVLYHLNRIFKLNINPIQIMMAKHYPSVLDWSIRGFQQFSSGPDFTNLVHRWNNIVSICVAAEPCFYERIFNSIKHPPQITLEEQRYAIGQHWHDLVHFFQVSGIETIKKIIQDLCVDAELLDPNKNVHTMLRLTHGRYRQRIEGYLGGTMLLLTMSEILRRAAEKVFNTELREEDELGFGITPVGVKERLYGSERILDGDGKVVNQFLRSFGLDYSVQIRWYVEGFTEYGALDSILGRFNAIELINLKGKVVQRGGKGIAFVDSLRNDIRAQVFSVILIDADNEDYIGLLRQAAKQDLICGTFFISDPDFEFANFTRAELEETIWQFAEENGASIKNRNLLHEAIKNSTSGKELISMAKRALPELNQLSKGIEWGKRLMKFAWSNPDFHNPITGEIISRPVIDAINSALRGIGSNYLLTRREKKVDPTSGKLIKRDG